MSSNDDNQNHSKNNVHPASRQRKHTKLEPGRNNRWQRRGLGSLLRLQHLGCQEVMWDSEGKDADTRVVRKLLQKYWDCLQATPSAKTCF